ncbi:M28 family metallopeptidase [Postechiella marina]|uniref:M28 family metallopeptidase n=1 Tax=Postechiella marina TaxID=943941 RepID=A0ABP8C0M1_9FLAO
MVVNYYKTITATELETQLYQFASDKFEGRETGTKGQKLASNFLKKFYLQEKIPSPFGTDNYYQDIPKSFLPKPYNASENVLAYIKGTEIPNELVIISAHLDHLGIEENGSINLGADDDGSGTVAIMQIAQAFNKAKKEGYGPKRSILFLHLTAEEIGKLGSSFYTKNPVFPLKNTVVNLNIDMIGRVDTMHKENPNYLYIIGADRLSKELHYLSEKVNHSFFNINLDYTYNNEDDVNDFYSRSDHYNFARHNIPVIFYFNGIHDDYHKTSDTPDKIDYPLLEKRSRLIFSTAWQIANQKNRLALDLDNKFLKN